MPALPTATAAAWAVASLSPHTLRAIRNARPNFNPSHLKMDTGAVVELVKALDAEHPGLIDRVRTITTEPHREEADRDDA